jgi:hypothetical protein
MFTAAIATTILLLLESLPSAVAGLARAGITRLDSLTRLGLAEGRNLRVVPLLGLAHLAGSAAVIAGPWAPPAGVAGAAVEAGAFAWVLARQLAHGDRGRALAAYAIFLALALAVLAVSAARMSRP